MKSYITFQKSCDVLVCGTTLYAIDTAIAAAATGRRTVLAMERTNPFIECICALRSHVPANIDRDLSPTLADVLTMQDHICEQDDRLYFNPHQVALRIEDRLIEAGVTFLYNAAPVSALMHDHQICGAVFGGKPGLFAVESATVVDCTLNTVIARTAGVPLSARSGAVCASYAFELIGEHEPKEIQFDHDGISGTMAVHRFFADFTMRIQDPVTGPFGYAGNFARAYAAATRVLKDQKLTRFRGADVCFHSGDTLVMTDSGKVTEVENLFVFGPMGIPDNTDGQLVMTDPLALHKHFPTPRDLSFAGGPAKSHEELAYRIAGTDAKAPLATPAQVGLKDPGFDEPGTEAREVVLPDDVATVETDVLIAGCGTSGVGAAYHAAKLGLSPLCIDGALEIGGTNTVGGVTNLWFGNETKAFEDFFEDCGAANDGLNASPFFQALTNAGATVLPATPICGAGYADSKLDCVYAISPEGLVRIKANRFIDATGDGSLAAWSGLEYAFGSERDGVSSWGSFGNFQHDKPEAARQFLSPVDERSPRDATRFIIAMRRSLKERLEKEDYVHPAFYIAARTTRHIRGGTTVTYLDMLAGRRFKDSILRASSNIDTKGTETSNAFKAGFYAHGRLEEFEVSIPYSSLIPVGMDNLIVVGKAYSITNDALTMARMQRDLFVLGMIAAEAVSISAGPLNQIDVKELQNRLISLGALRRDDISEDDYGFERSPAQIVEDLLSCGSYVDSLRSSARLLVLGKDVVMPSIDQGNIEMTPAMARLLCFWHVEKGVDSIRNEAEQQLSGQDLPLEIYAAYFKAHMLPDHGFSPLPVLQLNNLALAGDHRVTELISHVADKFDQAAESHATLWGYAFGAAYVAERMADPAMVDSLRKILAHPVFDQPVVSVCDDFRACADITRERRTYLRLCLLRALARCGSKEGVVGLIEFLDEARVSFAVNARDELVAVTGQDFGCDLEVWRTWLQEAPDSFPPTPVTENFD